MPQDPDLQALPQELAAIVEHALNFVGLADLGGKVRYVNPAGLALCELNSLAQARGMRIEQFLPREEQRHFGEVILPTIFTAGRIRGEGRLRRFRSGTSFPADFQAFLLKDADGQPSCMGVVMRDLSSRDHALAALRESEQRFRGIGEHAGVGIGAWTPRGELIWLNRLARDYLGIDDLGDLEGRHVRELFPPEAAAVYLQRMARALRSGQPQRYEDSVDLGSGPQVFASTYARQLDDEGRVVGVLIASQDITALRRAEDERSALQEQLHASRRMDAMVHLAGGVAHEFTNLLTSMAGHLELALLDAPPTGPVTDHIRDALRAARSASGLTSDLLAFGQRQTLRLKAVDLGQSLGHLQRLLERVLGEDIELIMEVSPDLHPVEGDPVGLEQALLGLTAAAREAMVQGGRLTLRARNATLEAAHGPLPPGDYVVLEVQDTGPVVALELRECVFEPFARPSASERGGNLSLAMAHGTILQHQGHMELVPTEQGACFRIWLPRAGSGPAVSEASEVPSGSGATVLVVEDEAPVLRLVVRTLERDGHQVLQAVSAEAALDLARSHPEPIHLLLTDLVLPGMDGRELADAMVRERPDITVLCSSGYPRHALQRRDLIRERYAFLPKPFRPRDLALRVRELLEGYSPQKR